jgi:pimeloyl-ACP methyl ester carboxylesterase
VNGVRLKYEDEGAGPSLVLVHGSWTNHHGWDRVAPRLAERFRVVRHDRRGHSESEALPGTLEDDASDIAALAESIGLGRFHLACSSRGGVIGLKLVTARPDLVRSIVCHEPPLLGVLPDREAAGELIAAEGHVVEMIERGEIELAAQHFVDDIAFGPGAWEGLPRFIRETFIENATSYADEYRDSGVYDVDVEALERYEGGVLLTSSDDSPEWFGAIIDSLATILPKAERDVYHGAGHSPQGTVPDEYVRVVSAFIERNSV